MSNTGSDKLPNASTNGNGYSHICASCDLISTLDHVIGRKKSDVQTRYEINENDENDQTSDYSNIEIPDISAPSLRYKWAIINIICLREFSFLLTKK